MGSYNTAGGYWEEVKLVVRNTVRLEALASSCLGSNPSSPTN